MRAASTRIETGSALPPGHPHGTVNEALARAASTTGGATFLDLKEPESRFTWSEVHERAKRTAAVFASQGVVPGDRVVVSAATSVHFLDAFFGAMLAGAVPVPTAPAARLQSEAEFAARMGRLVTVLQARVVVTDEASAQALQRHAFETPATLLAADGLANRGSETLALEVRPDDVAILQLSSGSLGDPKPVAIAHRHLTQHSAILAEAMPGVRTTVGWLPLYHDMGLTGLLLQTVVRGGDLVIFRPDVFIARPALWLQAMSRFRGEFGTAPNFAYAMCLSRVSDEEMEGTDLSAWRHVLNGAEPIQPALFRKFGKRFARWGLDVTKLRPTYGLAEATLGVTISPEGAGIRTTTFDPEHFARTGEIIEGRREICSVGPPYPSVSVEVRGPEGALAERRVGRVWILSATNMLGYHGNEAATKDALVDGWLDSGDLGFISEGELYIVARAKDIVVIRGGNHAPEEFEDCLLGVAGVRPGAAIAVGSVQEDSGGEELVLLVETLPGIDHEDLIHRIRTAVLQQTGIRPHTIALAQRGSLPRTTSGKHRRAEALRRFVAGELPLQEQEAVAPKGA
jgi:acyl-CoA synthetase (AMP-forming)/AMP-acid ligase II